MDDAYLIKLRVESLFNDRCFVLGFLVNVWLQVPVTEECFTVVYTIHYCSYVKAVEERITVTAVKVRGGNHDFSITVEEEERVSDCCVTLTSFFILNEYTILKRY